MRGRLWTEESIADFGANPFDPYRSVPLGQVSEGDRKRLREGVRSECRNEPGVYGMLDDTGALIYVGKSKQLRTRLLSYFTPRSRNEKAGRILKHTRTILWEPAPSEFAALLRELHLIQTRRPAWNVKDMPRRVQPWYVCMGRPHAPGVFVTNRPATHVRAAYGPFRGGRRVREAVEVLNRHFRLRDCANSVAMRFADQGELFGVPLRAGCLRVELGSCHGPCVAACSRRDYMNSVRAAQRFLDGSDLSLLDTIGEQMTRAAALRRFELAARLRDELESLTIFREMLDRLVNAQEKFTFVYPHGSATETLWYLIRAGRVAGVVQPPTDADTAKTARREIDRLYQATLPPDDLTHSPPDTLLLVSSWFHQQPEQLAGTLPLSTARRRCTLQSRAR